MLLTVLSFLQMPCPSCRPFSHIGTLATTTCLLLLPPSAEAMQSPCSGIPPTSTCLAMRLLTLWQLRAQQKSKWMGLPATLTITKAKLHTRWRLEHPRYNKTDPYCLLPRQGQMTVFRFSTGHNRLNHHLYSKLRIGHTKQCPCGTGSQTTEHLLQSCSLCELLRKEI